MISHDTIMFIAGVFWGAYIVRPLLDVIEAVWTNAKKRVEDERAN